jgi:transcriptional regulator with XRE-family HTH domain
MLDFSPWLENELKKRGLSHNEIARRSRLSQTQISNVILGNRKPGAVFCIKVANGLDLPPVAVLKLAGILPPDSQDAPPIEFENVTLAELNTIAAELPPDKQKQVLDFAKFLKGK